MPDNAAKETKKTTTPPGKKGGRRFPQYPLNDAVKWADKLVSKTHGGPQPDDLIRASVVDAKSSTADIRISVLKQFDLMEGNSKGYSATSLAKEIRSAPDEEKPPLYARAALKPEVFNAIYETFHGDSVSLAKLKQRAGDLHVHPDAVSKCVDVYVETMEFAGLVSRNGDQLVHASKGQVAPPSNDEADAEGEVEYDDDRAQNENSTEIRQDLETTGTRRGVATVQVNINLDSSLDTDKLQKQLELLRRYGAL